MKAVKTLKANIKIKMLFKKWLEITKVFHRLTDQQMDVLALFLFYHYELKKEITNEKILWKLVFDYSTKAKIKEELGLADAGLQNVITKLRKRGVVVDNKVVTTYVPQIDKDTKSFEITFNFNIIDVG